MLLRYPYLMAEGAAEGGSGGDAGTLPASDAGTPPAGPGRDSSGRFTSGDGTPTGPIDWRLPLTPEEREYSIVKDAKSFSDFVRNAQATKTMVGNSVQLPKADMTPEQRAAHMRQVWGKFGCPESPEGYTITPPTLPEGVSWDDAFEKEFRARAWAHGLSQEAVNELVGYESWKWTQLNNMVQAAKAEDSYKFETEIAKKHGAGTQHVKEAAAFAMEVLGSGAWGGTETGKEALEFLRSVGAFQNVAVVSAFANIYDKMSEASYLTSGTSSSVTSFADVEAEYATLTEKGIKQGLSEAEARRKSELADAKLRFQQRSAA